MRNIADSCVEANRTAEAVERSMRFFRCTALIMLTMLLPAALQALLNLVPDLLQPDHIAVAMSLALSASIVATAALVAALVRVDDSPRG